jgi:tetratricopeptide (TPR) repeat protein
MKRSGTGGGEPGRRWKGIVFRLMALSLPIVAFLVLEMGARLVGGPVPDRHINITPFSVFERVTIDGVESYRITHKNQFPKREAAYSIDKPEGGIRIICVGGSACAGWPHPAAETFDRYLQRELEKAYPGRPVEVINAAAHGFASYRVRRIFDQMITLEPDVVIIWSGNNEFLEDREYDLSAGDLLTGLGERSRLVQLARGLVRKDATELSGEELEGTASFFWKKAKGEALSLRENPAKFERVKEHYAESIGYMVDEAGRRGVEVLLCTVPSNLSDWLPTVSKNGLEGADIEAWEKLSDLGRRHVYEGEADEGIALMEEAISMEPEHGETYFWLGRLQEKASRPEEALASYRRAKDMDFNPFRAHSVFNETVRELAGKNDFVTLVDLEKAFDLEADGAAPGFDLFLDYVHPTKRGNLIVAEKVFQGILGVSPGGLEPVTDDFDRMRAGGGNGYDESTDLSVQKPLYSLYSYSHQYSAAIDQARHMQELYLGEPMPEDVSALSEKAPEKYREGYAAFRKHLEVRHRQILGERVSEAEEAAAARQLQAYFEKWHHYDTF